MMPMTIIADSVSEALACGLSAMAESRQVVREGSRNGGVSVWDGPVTTHYRRPLNRVLFSPMRNANPFFHLFESLWMLGGRNDLPWITQFNRQMKAYSDDGGKTQPAAYGHRWRNYFGYDQIPVIAEELRKNPSSRRCVLSMWDGWGIHTFGDAHHFGDLHGAVQGSADVPCNTHCYFTLRDGRLHMMVSCRSNDILWGAYGANAVHFSILLEYMAALVGVEVGTLTQVSWNWHLYDGILKYPLEAVVADLEATDYYTHDGTSGMVVATPIFTKENIGLFHGDLPRFLDYAAPSTDRDGRAPRVMHHPFLRDTAMPMLCAWDYFKRADLMGAVQVTHEIKGDDWRVACNQWMTRRYDALHLERNR